jgi:hypothetical protein
VNIWLDIFGNILGSAPSNAIVRGDFLGSITFGSMLRPYMLMRRFQVTPWQLREPGFNVRFEPIECVPRVEPGLVQEAVKEPIAEAIAEICPHRVSHRLHPHSANLRSYVVGLRL